ncbi:hypothetical protein KY328_03310 [Candidatus Woesearchaeota archaeon]|nr:hypothetical protein [Candidatus Woesearchaeota archaeon]MBW3021922.1 hypothetical protein [Candidatus Woesearchaeota archaeon]
MSVRFHLVKSEQIKDVCPYCGKDLEDVSGWRSEFHLEMHYKKIKCSCGKENLVKVDFHGSGHDDWDGKPTWENPEDIAGLIEEEHSKLDNADIETEDDD